MSAVKWLLPTNWVPGALKRRVSAITLHWPNRTTAAVVTLLVIAVALVAIAIPTNVSFIETPFPLAYLFGLVQFGALPLAYFSPKWSVTAFLGSAAIIALNAGSLGPAPWPFPVTAIIGQAVILSVLALRQKWTVALGAWALGIVVGMLVVTVSAWQYGRFEASAGDVVTFIVTTGIVLLVSILVGQRSTIRAQLRSEQQVSAAEQARRELVEVRAQIARELHDIVAHGMSIVAMQASTARYRLPSIDEATSAEFDEIATTARGTLAEMRQLLGVLRADGSTESRTPQPTADQIRDVVERARSAGVTVDLETEGSLHDLPAAVSLTVYRTVQEALSNVVRHAPSATARVSVVVSSSTVHVSVENGPSKIAGSPPGPGPERGSGLGLVGIRERAALVGGTTSAGPTDDGGFSVTADLPLGAGAAATGAAATGAAATDAAAPSAAATGAAVPGAAAPVSSRTPPTDEKAAAP